MDRCGIYSSIDFQTANEFECNIIKNGKISNPTTVALVFSWSVYYVLDCNVLVYL